MRRRDEAKTFHSWLEFILIVFFLLPIFLGLPSEGAKSLHLLLEVLVLVAGIKNHKLDSNDRNIASPLKIETLPGNENFEYI